MNKPTIDFTPIDRPTVDFTRVLGWFFAGVISTIFWGGIILWFIL